AAPARDRISTDASRIARDRRNAVMSSGAKHGPTADLVHYEIHQARVEDVLHLQSIERDAAGRYGASAEMRFCLDLPVRDAAEHGYARDRGLALTVACDGAIVGFLLAVPKDRCVHLQEVAVALAYQGRGFGRALLAEAEAWAVRAGFAEMTLTTFRDVP